MTGLRLTLVLISPLFALNGCGFFAAQPTPDNLHAEWTVNDARERTFGQDAPVFLRLTLVNTSNRHVKLPVPQIKPVLVASQAVTVTKWTSPEDTPGILGPHEVWQGTWMPEARFPTGSYSTRLPEEAGFDARPCQFTVTGKPTPAPLRFFYENAASRIAGDPMPAIQKLRERLASGNAAPEIRLQLADLLHATGHPHEARAHYERFASDVFGPGEKILPAWLEARLGEDESPSPQP